MQYFDSYFTFQAQYLKVNIFSYFNKEILFSNKSIQKEDKYGGVLLKNNPGPLQFKKNNLLALMKFLTIHYAKATHSSQFDTNRMKRCSFRTSVSISTSDKHS